MEWIKQLSKLNLKENRYSQYGEEIIIDYIFQQIGTTNKTLVDIGAGGAGKGLLNSKFLLGNGWGGLLFYMDGHGEGIIKKFFFPFYITEILKKNIFPKEFYFLCVEINSFFYNLIYRFLN